MFRRVLTREMQRRFEVFGISSRKKVIRDIFFENGQLLLKPTESLLIIILLQITEHRR